MGIRTAHGVFLIQQIDMPFEATERGAVDISGRRFRRMAKLVPHINRRGPALQHDLRRRMPSVMDPDWRQTKKVGQLFKPIAQSVWRNRGVSLPPKEIGKLQATDLFFSLPLLQVRL